MGTVSYMMLIGLAVAMDIAIAMALVAAYGYIYACGDGCVHDHGCGYV